MIPRYYQQQSHDAAWQYLNDQSGSPLIVLPTGAGKSLVIAMLVRQALAFSARVIVLQHRKELIQQNTEKIQTLLPETQIGINSAGLGERSSDTDVVCAGIQSVHRKAHEFGRRELVIIDEVHLVGGDESMYGKFLNELQQINPRLRLVGLTATPFRTGEGPICGREKLFQRICYEAQTGDLIKEGFLCQITNKPATNSIDTSEIKIAGGEFVGRAVEKTFDTDDNVAQACSEIVEKCHDRHSVLIFGAGVHHAESIAAAIKQITGEKVGVVTGETVPMLRTQYLTDFRDGHLRWLVNCDVLTTGFDAPCIDAIAVLRATMSPGLFAQIVGRGLRKHDSKTECLILDFGENIKRHGSLDDSNYGRSTPARLVDGQAKAVENNGRGKECFNCGQDVAANAQECPDCGFMFPVNHDSTADEESSLTGDPGPERWEVVGVSWSKHNKRNAPEALPTLRVDYEVQPADSETGNLTKKRVSEWVCFEHKGFAFKKARQWWITRSLADTPETVHEAIALLDRVCARHAAGLTTIQDGKFQRITSVDFRDDIPLEMDWLPEPESAEEFEIDPFGVPF